MLGVGGKWFQNFIGVPRLKGLQNTVLKQYWLKEKAPPVLIGRGNLCPESETGGEVLLVGLRQRFPALGSGGEGSLHWEEGSFR